MSKTLEVGSRVTVVEKLTANPKWSIYVKPGTRLARATGNVVGFYRPGEWELVAVHHDGGGSGVYEVAELE
jgi:hypothetical protein